MRARTNLSGDDGKKGPRHGRGAERREHRGRGATHGRSRATLDAEHGEGLFCGAGVARRCRPSIGVSAVRGFFATDFAAAGRGRPGRRGRRLDDASSLLESPLDTTPTPPPAPPVPPCRLRHPPRPCRARPRHPLNDPSGRPTTAHGCLNAPRNWPCASA
jgi:hypothetical protein